MSKRVIRTGSAPAAIGPYSQGVVTSHGMLYTAGQIALDPSTGQLVEGDVKVQTRRVLENIKAILESGGSSLANVIKTTVFIKDMNEFTMMNEVYL